MQNKAQKNLLKVFVELYNRSQQPILTSDLFRGVEYTSIYEDMKAGKDYPQKNYYDTGILKVHKQWSVGKKEVVWNTRYPDLDMVEMLWRYRKNGGKTVKTDKVVTPIVEVLRHEEVPTPIEKTSEIVETPTILSIDDICKRFDVEFENYHPNIKTIPNVINMLNVMEYKAGKRWCHKDSLFCTTGKNDEGKLIDINNRAGTQFLRKRLVIFNVIIKNPDNNNEYLYVAEYDDIDVYARKLAFAINYFIHKNDWEEKRITRLITTLKAEEQETQRLDKLNEERFIKAIETEIDRKEVEEVVETPNTFGFSDDMIEALMAELQKTRESNEALQLEVALNRKENQEVKIELKEMSEVNKLLSTDLSEKMVGMHQVTVTLTEAVKTNNLISEK